jgi:hypothetical protein
MKRFSFVFSPMPRRSLQGKNSLREELRRFKQCSIFTPLFLQRYFSGFLLKAGTGFEISGIHTRRSRTGALLPLADYGRV